MRFKDLFFDTLRTLWGHKLRTCLTMFGIAWGIVSIVLMTAAGEGLRAGQEKVSQTFAKDLMIVFAGRTSLQAGGLRAGRKIIFQSDDLQPVQQASPDCRYVMPEIGNNVAIHSDFNAASLIVAGSAPEFFSVRSVDVAEGRAYNWEDVREHRRVAVLGSDAKKQLFAGRDAIGEHVYLASIPYTIIGVTKHKEQDSSYDGEDINKIFIPYTAMLLDFPNKPPQTPNSLDRLLVVPASLPQHEPCKREVLSALALLHNFDPADREAADVWDTIEDVQAFAKMTDGMKYFLGAVGFTTLVLGGLGVMNVMLVSVRERTREIGVRKAVGATSNTILRQIFAETLIIVGLSGAVGFSVAFGFCALVNMFPMPEFFAGLIATWGSALAAFAVLGVVAVLAALYPARKAASIDPIEALRFEAGG